MASEMNVPLVTDRTAPPESPLLPVIAMRGLAVAQLALVGAGELTRLIAETHATIRRAPLPWKHADTASAEQAPLPYQMVMQTFLRLARQVREFVASRDHGPAGREWGLVRSALNGVAGDTLAQWDNALDHGLALCNEFGEVISADEWQQGSRRGLVLFVHGLCLSEREWQTFEHSGFVRELREDGHGVAWLRYNSGRPIHENGAALAALLATLPEGKHTRLTLVGHSMGGLVIRSASHHAAVSGHGWLARLRGAAYLGTPHQGAPLERLGHGANSLLALTPYTKPLMKIGNLRSAGIMDLRHGRVTPPDHEPYTPLPEGARHLLVAGHLGRGEKRHWLGDGLVPVRSALGQHVDLGRALGGKHVTRVEFSALGHMAMLGDARVYGALREWLREK
ncbi:MAG: hypothetical protein Q8J78_08730 [Moraxellaceae bacterium]|nr:hypothetical protein [Moraxellaceae bacterium]